MSIQKLVKEYFNNRSEYKSQAPDMHRFKSDFFAFLAKNKDFSSTVGVRKEHLQLVDRLSLASINDHLDPKGHKLYGDEVIQTYRYKHPLDQDSDYFKLGWNLTEHNPLAAAIHSDNRDIKMHTLLLLFFRGIPSEEVLRSRIENAKLKSDGKRIVLDDGVSHILLGEFNGTSAYCHAYTPSNINPIPSILRYGF